MYSTCPTTLTRPLLALAAALVMLAGTACTDPASTPPAAVPPELETLFEMVRQYRLEQEGALALIVAGDVVEGRTRLDAAGNRLAVAAQLCARTEGCDTEVFLSAMERALHALRTNPPDRPFDDTWHPDATSGSPFVHVSATPPRAIARLSDDDLRGAIPMNSAVKAALNDWLTWNRPALMSAWENYQFLKSSIAPVYRDAGLPEALLFGMLAKESGAKVHAYSRAGAAGPLQFMPHTGRRYGLGSVNGFDMRLDPVAATRANVAYLDDRLRNFDDDLGKSLAAYNVGETKLRRLHRGHVDADFWDPRIYYGLPWETRDYVPQVFAAALLFLDPEAYGLELPELDTRTTRLTLVEDISLGELAVCLGQAGNRRGWFRTLRNLNPRRGATDRIDAGERIDVPEPLVPIYADRCIGDAGAIVLARELHDASYPDEPELAHYTVRGGDTLARIASRGHCWTVRKLAALNSIEAPEYVIQSGQRLVVPRCS